MPDHRIVWKSGHAPGAQAERSAPQERLRKTERKEIDVRSGLLRIVILGPSLASTSDNDYATIFRPLLRALAARGHHILFLERTGEFATTAFNKPDYCRLEFYDDLKRLERFRDKIITADVVIVSSHLSEGSAVAQFVQKIARGVVAFYDLDTPTTLEQLEAGTCTYLTYPVVRGYDLYLSATDGPILRQIKSKYEVPFVRQLHCSVEPEAFVASQRPFRWDLSFVGDYSADRHSVLQRLIIEPARRAPHLRLAVAGAHYPSDIDWPGNVERFAHVTSDNTPEIYAASRFALNISGETNRTAFVATASIFAAAAAGTAVIADPCPSLASLFKPDREILIATRPEDVLAFLLSIPESRRRRLAQAVRRRVLAHHTADRRAHEFQNYIAEAMQFRQQREVAGLSATR